MTVWKQLPNALSIFRILSVPFFVYFIVFDKTLTGARIALGLYFLASITDIFDGKIARKYHLESRIGGILDATADKCYIVAGVICPMIRGFIPWWMVVLIFAREAYVLWLGYVAIKKKGDLSPTFLRKFKTVLQMSGIVAILIITAISGDISWSGFLMVDDGEITILTLIVSAFNWVGLVVSYMSIVEYTKRYIDGTRDEREKKGAGAS